MRIDYSAHANMRMRIRGISKQHVEYVLNHPQDITPTQNGCWSVIGRVENRTITIVMVRGQKHIKIVTVI